MSTIAVNQITDTSGLLAPTFPPGSAQLNPMAGRDDEIINGDFGVWQRGTSFATSVYGADRWVNGFLGGAVTQSRQAFALGDTLGVNNPIYYLRQAVSGQTLTSQYAVTEQRIEGVRTYAGQTITILGWARRSSGAGNITVECAQSFGSGGVPTPSIPVQGISPTTISLTGSWAPFAAVITVPSITGKTLGTDGKDHLAIRFWSSAGSDYNTITNSIGNQTIGVDLWGIHVRYGTWTSAATADYRPRDPGTELTLCYRYYQVINLARMNGTTYIPNGDTRARFDYLMPMRVPPLLSQSGTMNVIASGATADIINIGLGAITLGSGGVGGGTIISIANYAAFSAAGGVMTWGDNGGGAFTVYAEAEI